MAAMSSWSFWFDIDTETIADVSRNAPHGGSYHRKAAATSALREQVMWEVKAASPPPQAVPVNVRVEQHSRTARHRDSDNVSGPAKAIIDALVKAGALDDDCPCSVLDVTLRQHNGQGHVPEGVHRFVVTVTPAEETA